MDDTREPEQPPPQILADTHDEKDHLRFEVELEFVQTLSNPTVLHDLAQRKFLADDRFVRYLAYLMYWTRSEYVCFVKYPICLDMLRLLQFAPFRTAVEYAANVEDLREQIEKHWMGYYNKEAQGGA